MKQLSVKNFGPISNAEVQFGDLTLLVGPQGSGKSIFVQLLKLLIDKRHIRKTLDQFNYVWGKDVDSILNLYFGEGMSGIWNADSEVKFEGKNISRNFVLPVRGKNQGFADAEEKLFYIPAQRILSVSDGRPKNFMEFDPPTPYVLRHFSEILRQWIQNNSGMKDSIFPASKRLKGLLRESFNKSIFHDGNVVMEEQSGQKKFRMKTGKMSIPFMTWSAGQKEFLPLLLGFYWLCPNTQSTRRGSYDYVVIEEPEMGLHPEAIKSVMLQVMDLISRGYKVVISTHSQVMLEFAWAFRMLNGSSTGTDALFDLFELGKAQDMRKLLERFLDSKVVNTFYFSHQQKGVVSSDISSLDAGSDNRNIAEWGGLSQFAGKAAEVVMKYADQ